MVLAAALSQRVNLAWAATIALLLFGAAFTVAQQGDNGISLTEVCNTAPQGAPTQSATFTVAGNTLTLFNPASTNGLGNVGVFTKQ